MSIPLYPHLDTSGGDWGAKGSGDGGGRQQLVGEAKRGRGGAIDRCLRLSVFRFGKLPRVPLPLVIAHHLLLTAYGWWLPNDPRGSDSTCIASDVVAELGELHRGRKKVQSAGWEIRAFYEQAKSVLRYPLLKFSAADVRVMGNAFADVIARQRYTCYACAIMPDHMPVAIRKHKHSAEAMIRNLQDGSRDALRAAGRRELDHPVWAQRGWKVFLDHPDDVRRTIRYVEVNPVMMRLPRQIWSFVALYDWWPLHPGHSPNSTYAKRLRDSNGRR